MTSALEIVVGGTFDPVHVGHLDLAEAIRSVLRVPRVLLLPAAFPPHKQPQAITPAHHREAMLRLAVAGRCSLEVSTLELRSEAVCFTIDSLRRLREGPPACSPVFVLGMDALLEIPTWRSYVEMLEEFDLIVIDRPGATDDDVRELLHPRVIERLRPRLGPDEAPVALEQCGLGRGGRVFPLDIATAPVSSSQVRAAAAGGRSLAGLVPPEVAEYIQLHGLYRGRNQAE